jgi:uncharacterized protein YjiS (DUF1127 family)
MQPQPTSPLPPSAGDDSPGSQAPAGARKSGPASHALKALEAFWRGATGRWRQHRRGMAELRLMTDRDLSDLGLGRGDVPALRDIPDRWHSDRC